MEYVVRLAGEIQGKKLKEGILERCLPTVCWISLPCYVTD